MEIILLTRPGNLQAIKTLEECHRRGVRIAAAIVEPKTWAEKVRRIRRFYRTNGFIDTLRKGWESVASDYRLDRVTQKAEGRRTPASVAEAGAQLGVPVHGVPDHNGSASEALLRQLKPDLLLVAGTKILRKHIFAQARLGCLNAHCGWLPEYRGLHANFWALMEGGKTGVTVHYVDAGVDTGSILLRKELPIVSGDTLESIELRTVDLCASLMTDAIEGIAAGTLAPLPQTADQGRQYRALSFRKEEEVRHLLRELGRQDHGTGKGRVTASAQRSGG